MTYAAFRQIGVPDTAKTQNAAKRHLRKAQRRIESTLNRPSLPPPATLLESVKIIRNSVEDACTLYPTKRLTSVNGILNDILETVQNGALFGNQCNTTTSQLLLSVYKTVSGIMQELSVPQKTTEPETDESIKKFLEHAAERGWKVADQQVTTITDGFDESIRCIQQKALSLEYLLSEAEPFGIVRGSILLLHETIPDVVLKEWTKEPHNLEVFIVFGQYLVLSGVWCIGISTEKIEKNETKTDALQALLEDTRHENEVLQNKIIAGKPKLINNHYYSPLMDEDIRTHRYFNEWDLLTQE